MRSRSGGLATWWLGVVLALVAACSAGTGERAAVAPTTEATGSTGAPSTSIEETSSSTTSSPVSAPPDPAVGDPPSPVPSVAPPTTRPSVPTVPVVPVGQLAPVLLRPGFGDRIVVEVRAQDGAAPRAATLEHLRQVLRDASGKEIVLDGVRRLGGEGRAWTSATIVEAAAAASAAPTSQVTLRLLFLRGSFEDDTGVLGVAVRGDVAAVFSDQVTAAAGLLVAPAVIEDAVTIHELGHLLGLVDLVLRAGRADPAHPGHSPNRRSVMYWQVESGAITQLLGGGIPTELDAADRAELTAIRAG